LIVSTTSAQWISILEGIHPRFKQVPPKGPSSTIATDIPLSDASAEISKPDPEPMTIKSNFSTPILLI